MLLYMHWLYSIFVNAATSLIMPVATFYRTKINEQNLCIRVSMKQTVSEQKLYQMTKVAAYSTLSVHHGKISIWASQINAVIEYLHKHSQAVRKGVAQVKRQHEKVVNLLDFVIKTFIIILSSQPLLGRHLGFHNFFMLSFFCMGRTFFTAWLFLSR